MRLQQGEAKGMTEHPNRTAVVATWVRIGLVALAVPQAVTGLWAILDPSGWFTEFPGFDPRLVAADPPYNAHLANDTGAGFLATAVALSLAAWWGERRTVYLALATYLAFAVPHLAYHAANPASGLSAAKDRNNVATLIIAIVGALVLAWGARIHPSRPRPRRLGTDFGFSSGSCGSGCTLSGCLAAMMVGDGCGRCR
jgi:hypothetical protein